MSGLQLSIVHRICPSGQSEYCIKYSSVVIYHWLVYYYRLFNHEHLIFIKPSESSITFSWFLHGGHSLSTFHQVSILAPAAVHWLHVLLIQLQWRRGGGGQRLWQILNRLHIPHFLSGQNIPVFSGGGGITLVLWRGRVRWESRHPDITWPSPAEEQGREDRRDVFKSIPLRIWQVLTLTFHSVHVKFRKYREHNKETKESTSVKILVVVSQWKLMKCDFT